MLDDDDVGLSGVAGGDERNEAALRTESCDALLIDAGSRPCLSTCPLDLMGVTCMLPVNGWPR